MSTNEPIFDEQQQADMRGLLGLLLGYFKDASSLFKESEVLVGPMVASITIGIGLRKPRELKEGEQPSVEHMREQDAFGERVGDIKKVLHRFYRDDLTIGAPLIQWTETGEEYVIARYRLVPNDLLGAEQAIHRAINRQKERLVA